MNLKEQPGRTALLDSDRIVASADGSHFFTFRPDWKGPAPLPFRAAAATIDLVRATSEPKILILGFGMGAMASMMTTRVPAAKIIGVEPDRALYAAASEELTANIALLNADAIGYLNNCTQTFDLILDDCFVVQTDAHGDQAPYRPSQLEVLPELAKAHLVTDGIYARNLLDQDDLPLEQQRLTILDHFHTIEERTFRDWDNALTIASDGVLDAKRIATLGN